MLKCLLIFILCILLINIDSSALPARPSTPPNGGDPIAPISSSESHSRGEYNLGMQEPAITIEKYIDGIIDQCNKNDNITIKLRFINCGQTNSIKSLMIIEEIPKGFKFISAYPKDEANVSNNKIIWNCGDIYGKNYNYIQYLNYTLNAIESGKHIIPSTIVDAWIIDNRYAKEYHTLKSSSNDLFITVLNQPPEIKLDPEPPIHECSWWNWLIHRPNITKFDITAIDPDDSNDSCEIFPSSNILSNRIDESLENGNSQFMWNLTLRNDKKSTYTLRVKGEKGITERNIIIDPYTLPDGVIPNFISGILGILGTIIVGVVLNKPENKEKATEKLNYLKNLICKCGRN